jgi:hypothetical protein
MAKEKYDVVSFRGGIDTYTPYDALQEKPFARDIKNATLRDGKLRSRKTLSILYATGQKIYSTFEIKWRGRIYVFYTTGSGLWLNGERLAAEPSFYCTLFYHRDYVYAMNAQAYKRYDLIEKVLRDVGLPKIDDDAFEINVSWPGPNTMVVWPADDATGWSSNGASISVETTIRVEGDASLKFATFSKSEGKTAERKLISAYNLTGDDQIDLTGTDIPEEHQFYSFWLYSTVDLQSGYLGTILIDNADLGTWGRNNKLYTPIPANTWVYFRISLSDINWEASAGGTVDKTLIKDIWIAIGDPEKAPRENFNLYFDAGTFHRKVDLHQNPSTRHEHGAPMGPLDGEYYYAITAIDRYGLESNAGRMYNPGGSGIVPEDSEEVNNEFDEYPESPVRAEIEQERKSLTLSHKGGLLTFNTGGAAGTLEAYVAANPGVTSFRVYRKGGSNTGWRYVGDIDPDNVKNAITSASMTTGSGLDDITFSANSPTIVAGTVGVKITVEGTPDTFESNFDGGGYGSSQTITGEWQYVGNGAWVKFEATTGHTLNDVWSCVLSGEIEQEFFDDISDDNLTVVGVWSTNASPQDRKSHILFFDKTTARLYIGFGPYLYYSESAYPDNVPYVNFIQLPEDVLNVARDALGIVVKTAVNTYRLEGTPGAYEVEAVAGGTGAISPWGTTVVRNLAFTYSDQRITAVESGWNQGRTDQEKDLGLALFTMLEDDDVEAYASYDVKRREMLLVHKGYLYYGQVDDLSKLEFTRSDDDGFLCTSYSPDTKRVLYGKEDGLYVESDEDATFEWKSVEQAFKDAGAIKDAVEVFVKYKGTLTLNVYVDEKLGYTHTFDSSDVEVQVRKKFTPRVRGRLIQFEFVGTGYVAWARFEADVKTLT